MLSCFLSLSSRSNLELLLYSRAAQHEHCSLLPQMLYASAVCRADDHDNWRVENLLKLGGMGERRMNDPFYYHEAKNNYALACVYARLRYTQMLTLFVVSQGWN